MSYKPPYVVLDFETNSLEYYRDDFEVVSCATAYLDEKSRTVSKYYDNPTQIRNVLKKLSEADIPLVVYNATFEIGVLECYFPGIEFKEIIDVMRLMQLYDGGGPQHLFGLKACVSRTLPEYAGYEEEIHNWILNNIPESRKSSTGAFLSQAPTELLSTYNRKDVEATLDLYELVTKTFEQQKFDWKVDHGLYFSSVKLITEAKIKGIAVNSKKLEKYITEIDKEIESIDNTFFTENSEAIVEVREMLKAKEQAKFKKKIVTDLPEFNISSKQHLEFLFQNVLKQQAKLKTPKGKPSFKSAHLGQWQGAELLVNRGKRILVRKQAETLLEKAAYDGKWHVDLKLCATVTGRAAGAGGLNIQALARRDKGFMECMEVDEGKTFISLDFSSGEPSIISFYSSDKRYKFATFEGLGQKPYWDNGVLMISDIYLMFSSVAPYSEKEIKDAWNKTYDGNTFAEQWVIDDEVIKKELKKIRNISKVVCLGLGYAMGPKTLKKNLDERGFNFDEATCKVAFKKYWSLFDGVKRFSDKKGREWRDKGRLITEFGFILHPDSEHKAMNAAVQGSLSSLIQLYGLLLKQRNPFMQFVSQIHDELLVQVPDELVEQFKVGKQLAQDDMNKELQALGWDVPMRIGWATGKNLYEAK